jgi:hypothetical protein
VVGAGASENGTLGPAPAAEIVYRLPCADQWEANSRRRAMTSSPLGWAGMEASTEEKTVTISL